MTAKNDKNVSLTRRENQIAEMIAWGAAKKDIARMLFLSEYTVENHVRHIFEKTGCTKANELSAWWFCTHFHISFDLSPLRRKIISMCLLALIIPQSLEFSQAVTRTPARAAGTTLSSRARRNEYDKSTYILS